MHTFSNFVWGLIQNIKSFTFKIESINQSSLTSLVGGATTLCRRASAVCRGFLRQQNSISQNRLQQLLKVQKRTNSVKRYWAIDYQPIFVNDSHWTIISQRTVELLTNDRKLLS